MTRVRVLGLGTSQLPGPSKKLASHLLHPLFSSIHSFSQFLLLSSLTPSCYRTPLVQLGLQGDREQLASIWCAPLARAPAPWAFRSPGGIILFPLTFGLGPMLPGFHHGQCASEATPGVPGPPMSWLGQARLAGRSRAGVSDLSPLLTREGGKGQPCLRKEGRCRARLPHGQGECLCDLLRRLIRGAQWWLRWSPQPELQDTLLTPFPSRASLLTFKEVN